MLNSPTQPNSPLVLVLATTYPALVPKSGTVNWSGRMSSLPNCYILLISSNLNVDIIYKTRGQHMMTLQHNPYYIKLQPLLSKCFTIGHLNLREVQAIRTCVFKDSCKIHVSVLSLDTSILSWYKKFCLANHNSYFARGWWLTSECNCNIFKTLC